MVLRYSENRSYLSTLFAGIGQAQDAPFVFSCAAPPGGPGGLVWRDMRLIPVGLGAAVRICDRLFDWLVPFRLNRLPELHATDVADILMDIFARPICCRSTTVTQAEKLCYLL